MQIGSLRQRLKELTAPFHAELEKMPVAIALADGSIRREKYAIYLTKLAMIHQMFEPLIFDMSKWGHYGIDSALRLRLPLLKADLAALNQPYIFSEVTPSIEIAWSFATAVGMMYVLEGSTMGGQVLSRKLSHMTGAEGVPCTRYFQAYGDNTMRLWGEFCQFLDRFEAENPNLCNQVILGACTMFLTMQKAMDELT
jgi:heme oxygenase